MTQALLFPSEPPRRFPVVHYRRSFTVGGVPVIAAVTNLTAAFLEELWDDDDTVRESGANNPPRSDTCQVVSALLTREGRWN